MTTKERRLRSRDYSPACEQLINDWFADIDLDRDTSQIEWEMSEIVIYGIWQAWVFHFIASGKTIDDLRELTDSEKRNRDLYKLRDNVKDLILKVYDIAEIGASHVAVNIDFETELTLSEMIDKIIAEEAVMGSIESVKALLEDTETPNRRAILGVCYLMKAFRSNEFNKLEDENGNPVGLQGIFENYSLLREDPKSGDVKSQGFYTACDNLKAGITLLTKEAMKREE